MRVKTKDLANKIHIQTRTHTHRLWGISFLDESIIAIHINSMIGDRYYISCDYHIKMQDHSSYVHVHTPRTLSSVIPNEFRCIHRPTGYNLSYFIKDVPHRQIRISTLYVKYHQVTIHLFLPDSIYLQRILVISSSKTLNFADYYLPFIN